VSVPIVFAQGTYTQIDFPGAEVTEATGINKAGDVVGSYVDAAGGHGFLLKGGVYTTIDFPGSQFSYAQGINDKGKIVGLAEPIGYLYDVKTQTFTTVQYPGAAYTYPLAINNAGTIAGYFFGTDQVYSGFELVDLTYTKIVPPGATGTFVNGISAAGKLVGFADIYNNYENFSFRREIYRQIKILHTTAPFVYGVNPAGTALVGSYEPFSGLTGFIYEKKTFQALSFPGSITTIAFGINATGDVVGYFIDGNIVTHGFLWTPPADGVQPKQSR
jgi:probable HAF family extracellular repeat protein